MKKNKFIFFSALLIVLYTSDYAFAFDVKNIIDSAKQALGISKTNTPNQTKPAPAKVPAQGKNPPPQTVAAAKAPAQVQEKPASTSTVAPAQGKNQPEQTGMTKTPVTNQTKPAPAGTTGSVQGKNPAVPVTPWGTSTPAESYSYNPVVKPDPFNPFIVVEKAVKKQEEKKAPTSIFPLQRADAESYRVVGIAGTEEHRVAIVEDVAKKFYPLLKGTRIGLNNGKVIDIMTDRVIVEEYDNKKPKRVILKLHKN